ncbi:hypothetical protein [Actinomadura formosensis]|uniref:hypothetical protein n=1 Tax=Actinomadura formosensis TaxID=60706 RepID=UPI0008335C05|nr:hypothetical protein [Actinomadura formosensis]
MTRPAVLTEEQVRELLPLSEALDVTRDALIAQAQGEVTQPDPWHLDIPASRGEVHVKGAWQHGAEYFAVKFATGFYGNGDKGLPVASGLSIIADATTGFPVAVALDNGYLTEARTAAAGALATHALARSDARVAAVIGPGMQGRAQMQALLELREVEELRVYGPNHAKASDFAEHMRTLHGWKVTVASSAEQAVRGAGIITTATPTRQPHIYREWLSHGAHITAVGADQPGKRELAPSVLAAADLLAADDINQARRNGELQYTDPERPRVVALGDVLAGRTPGRASPADITIADLTGLGVQDAAVGTAIALKLKEHTS